MSPSRPSQSAGFTLLEVLVAVAVLAMIGTLVTGAFRVMVQSKEALERMDARYREGRSALARVQRDLESAYISLHKPINQGIWTQKTVFMGKRGSPACRLDFATFGWRRLERNAKESDQAEVSYYGSQDPEKDGVTDLARRSDPLIDLFPDRGGRVQVLATDIDLFALAYLDPQTGQWKETWDTTQATGEIDRLPLQVRVVLVLNGGERTSSSGGRNVIRLTTKVTPRIPKVLRFATD